MGRNRRRNKRTEANPLEQAMGVQGTVRATAQDMFTNAGARMGFGTPSLGQGADYTLVRLSYDYWQLITLFRNHWISRRIVEVPAQDMVKAWPRLTSDLDPKDLTRIDRAIRKTNTKNNTLTGLTWGRLFGGAGALMVIEGQENELDQPLDLDSVGLGSYKGLIPFDRWAGVSPLGDVCTDINRPLDFNKPEMYECRISGGASFQVHSSRLLRFLGPTVPTPEVEAQSYWGISVLEPTYESITMLDNMYWNVLSLSFRANLLGMKFPELAQLLSGLGSSQIATQKFEQRMNNLNHLMSNNSLIPLPADGSIESTQYSFGGLDTVLQLFQLNLAGAAQMPITRLFGRTYSGLGQAGDGDERIYEEKISTDQSTYLVPQLEKLYPVICMSELGEVPDDLDLSCPSIRVLTEQEKSELAKSTADTLVVYMNGGIMSPRVVGREVKQSSDVTGIGTNLTDEDIEKLSDDVQSEGELGEGLFGGEGAGLNEASSPAKAMKSENEEGKKEDPEAAKREALSKAGEAQDTAPALDALPSGLAPGEKLIVGGKVLTVKSVARGQKDLFGAPVAHVYFTDGTVVSYHDEAARAKDARNTNRSAPTAPVGGNFCKSCGQPVNEHSDAQLAKCAAVAYRPEEEATKAQDEDGIWLEGLEQLSIGELERLLRMYESGSARHTPTELAMLRTHLSARKVRGRDEDGASSSTRLSQAMMDYHALPVRVETRQGEVRTGVTPDGRSWRTVMPADYGFIEGVTGADGDNLDCYVGRSPESSNVYVVDQSVVGKPGKFDEHKVMLGYHTQESALEDYMLGHHKSKDIFMKITPFTMPMFRRWLKTHNMKNPCGA